MTGSIDASSRTITIRDVAALAGVSPMTVSRTLAGGLNVRPDVQEKVLVAVRELGYHRNENARSIRPGQRSGLIGVAITNLANPYYGNFALGVEEVANRHGKRIVLGNTSEDGAREQQLVADFIGRQVEGLILVPAGGDAAHLAPGRLGGTPLVLASRGVAGVDVDTVLLDDVGGAYQATTRLLDVGHTRIGYLGNAASVFTGQRRFAGYQRAMSERGQSLDPALIHRDQQDVEAAQVAMDLLLELESPPTAIFSANNRNTIGALKEIGRRLRLGATASEFPMIASFDDFELSELMPVPVIVVAHDARALGREAATLLFDRLERDIGSPVRTVQMPVMLVDEVL